MAPPHSALTISDTKPHPRGSNHAQCTSNQTTNTATPPCNLVHSHPLSPPGITLIISALVNLTPKSGDQGYTGLQLHCVSMSQRARVYAAEVPALQERCLCPSPKKWGAGKRRREKWQGKKPRRYSIQNNRNCLSALSLLPTWLPRRGHSSQGRQLTHGRSLSYSGSREKQMSGGKKICPSE